MINLDSMMRLGLPCFTLRAGTEHEMAIMAVVKVRECLAGNEIGTHFSASPVDEGCASSFLPMVATRNTVHAREAEGAIERSSWLQ
jgi:hypothetical protein